MADSLPSLAFLGAGSMGGAILRGVIASGIRIDGGITATNRTAEKAEAFSDLDGVTSIALAEQPEGNTEAAAGARIVLVGVKPAMVPDLLREIAPHLATDAIVVSVAAGVTLQTFADVLGAEARVIRSMPNTPSTVRKGVTGLAAGAATTAEDLALVRRLFETVGAVVEVPESQIDALSTISGSGPAYVYLLIEEFTKAAVGMGFTDADARLMVEQTFIGATALLDASGEDPAELRRRVTSPKGTTERAVAVLQDAHLDRTFADAAAAALARAKELAAGS
ncbi:MULTISPECIES: pyrroline-5-carboxylate reductase [unclassified Microbacterium]|uniref:pyrroline-5-carboxylate reductase n=1 Tax=unclassified Microbacterium TaxID=2609290 RepID=UPI000CFBEF0C|nr:MULTISPECIES: pyrroline-5-carboxylate reductase [unclassified Microbacterium]PQZ53699.1 pyrroline-5-carboxylate reductase [Microbacterium sp. MYb43]PQZ76272.1 pyrroline-5-carboxylate reductase [Microbacterium sp. MYb40]PRB21384.1 pyrroline-5-carboxylate reductase [Microbacterium sp. MYb54]PRB29948.1 pyrroline-5-carboxylate reductase [Microbacterium sp. MYb50]PRB67892.1 pyrroline-5-carboxylate reductase [Microbacterium sp. MYb24]